MLRGTEVDRGYPAICVIGVADHPEAIVGERLGERGRKKKLINLSAKLAYYRPSET
jgi:hypothetical protein